MNNPELKEILEEFVTEAEETLDHLEQNLISLESAIDDDDYDSEIVDEIFRSLHTLKGGAGFLGLIKMQELGHAGETLLDEIRSGNVKVTTDMMNALFKTNDLLKDLLDCVRNDEEDTQVETIKISTELKALSKGSPSNGNEKVATKKENIASDVEINQDLLDEINSDPLLGGEPEPAPALTPDVEINQDLLDEINGDPLLGEDEDEEKEKEKEEEASIVNPDLLAEIEQDDKLLSTEVIEATPEKLNRRNDDRRDGTEERRKTGRRKMEKMETTIRVETGRLDQVMNLVGELVLSRNSLVRQLKATENQKILSGIENIDIVQSNLELLSRVTQDLQKSVLHTRMQPIKKVFDKIPRQVRELKSQLGKEVNLMLEGEMTEVDKTLVEELSDPMVHLIRNALDHGIESKEDRVKAGKSSEGSLIVRAFYEGNNIVIQVAEDGKGMDVEKIKAKAIEKGVVDAIQADSMSDKEIFRLVLEPGFSTAETVSDVSGRGVGMDVVNTKITSIKGSIDIDSTLGKGTTISMYVPLTLAIVQALVVRAGFEGFAIPIGAISEVVGYDKETVHEINSKKVVEIRGEVIPLFFLNSITKHKNIENEFEDIEEALDIARVGKTSALAKSIRKGHKIKSDGYIIIVRDASMVMGVCIDALIGQEEAVVKSITDSIDYNPAISGATITGDGGVHMILDIPYLMRDIHRKKSTMMNKNK
ncbi:MAG: chemotaxis protein CheA [Proteobacteria bacterium]|nr:chemotaxis protein CheA [Pseudomonadota bacterium]